MSQKAQFLHDIVEKRFSTLAFCPRWLCQEAAQASSPSLKDCDRQWWSAPLSELCTLGVVERYPPLADLPGSYTAQYEHTILLHASGKEVLTRGADY